MTKKEYEISVRANKKSIEQLKANLTTELNNAFENVDSAGKVKGLSRSDKAAIKADLSSLFGIADEQAEALRKMVQGIIPSDTKSIDHMKAQLQDTLKFATGIMEQMKLLGDSTDWMKQGVSFVDKFVGMQSTLLETQNVVSGIQTSVDKLTESFKTFKDALAITNSDAYLKRFSSEAKLAVDDVIKAQEILNKASKSRNQKVKTMAIASDADATDYTDMSVDDVREEYTLIIQAIKDGNAEIERLEAQFKGRKRELHDSHEYQMQLRGLAEEVQNLQNLSKHPLFKDAFAETGTQINANLKAVTAEITNAAEKAGRELKEVIESLKGDGIEISVTLPDPDAAEFGSKISEFVTKASAQFKKKPIEISLDLSNPFKDAKKVKEQTAQGRKIKGIKEVFERHANEAGVAIGDSLNGLETTDTSRIVQNLIESFNKVYSAVKTGQATVTEATNQWRKEMLKALTLKATFDGTDAKAEAAAMMTELQNFLDTKPLYIDTDTDELIQSIQQALNEAKFTVDVKAGNIDGSGVVSNVQIGRILNGLSNVQLATSDDTTSIAQLGDSITQSKTVSVVNKNSDAVEESTREQRILTDEIKRLQHVIDTNTETNQMSEESNRKRAENAKKNSTKIEDLQKNISIQQEKREEYSNLRQRHIANRAEAEKAIGENRNAYVKRSGAVKTAIKEGDAAFVQQELDSVIRDLNNEKKEMLAKLAAIDVNDPNNKKTIASYEKRIAQIDGLLGSDKDKGQIVLDALYRAYQNQKQELESKISAIQYNIDRLTRNIESTWIGQDAAKAEIDKITQEASIERSDMSIQTRQKESTKAQKRIDNINNVIANGQSPATLVLDEVNKFWKQSSKTIERTEKEIAESTEALKKLDPKSKEYADLNNEIQKKQAKVNSWKNRQALMSQKGLTDMSDVGLEDAIKTLTEVLRKSPTISDELLHSDELKSLSATKNIAYYSGIAQDALGFRTQTEQEYVDEKTLQAKFVELFRINEFLKKIGSMFPRNGAEPKVADVEAFINFFEKVPEMSSAVESAKKYLIELNNIAELQAKDETFATFKEAGLEDQYFPQRAQELWGQMDDTIRATLSQELSSRGIDAKNFANLEDASSAFEQMKTLYKEGVFDSVKSENGEFKQLVTLLKQSTAVDSTKNALQTSLKSITTSFEGRLKSVLFDALNTNEPISVKIVDSRGNEHVYDIHEQGRGTLNSDKSFSTNTKSLNSFLKISGLEKQMSEIVYAMFNDPDLAKTLIDNLFADGKVQLASKQNAFIPKSAQKYTFDTTALGQYIKNEEKNASLRAKLEAELIDIQAGKYDESIANRLKDLPEDQQTDVINQIVAFKQKQLAALQQLDLTEDQIVQSLVALANDIEIAEAKVQQSQQGSRQNNKKAQRLLKDGVNSWDYKTAQRKAKKNTFDKDYNLTQLLSRIDLADQFGLMDTGVLTGLADDYLAKQEEARELTDLNKAGRVGKEQVDKAWDELRKARRALIDAYYQTEGWYLTNLAHSRMETAENEIRRMNKDASEDDVKQVLEINDHRIVNELKGKSDVQAMASEKYEPSAANNKKNAENEAIILAEKKKQLKALMEKYGITTEMLDAERNLTRVSGESADAVRQADDNIASSDSGTTRTSGGTKASFIGALNASNLATESTLRGIYELLNGGAPKGGWDNADNTTSNKTIDASERDISTKSSEGKFISSLTGLINRMSTRKTEAAALIGKDGQLGSLVEGQKNKVSSDKISTALAKQVKDVLAVLHNHPTGLSSLSQGDVQATFARAYGKGIYSKNKPVKVSGSIANGLLTSINFNGIDEQVAQQIIEHYNLLLSKLPEQFGDVFAFEDGKLIVSDEINKDSELRAGVSNILSATIKSAFEKFGYGDAFQQVDVKNIDVWRDSVVTKAQQQVIENIIDGAASTVIEGTKTAPNLENFDAATTKELAQYIGSNFKKDNGKNIAGSRQLSAAMYDLSRLDIFADGFTPNDVNSEKLAKAWNQLQNGLEQEVTQQLNDDVKAYIQLLQFKLQEIADANGLDYNAINSAVDARKVAAQDISGTKLTKDSVEAAKNYLGTFTKTNKKGDTVKQTGISRAQSGLKNVYSVLSNGRDTLTNSNLKDLGTGYYQLVETINHEIFSKLNEETQQLLIQARDAALATLDKYGVKVYGSGELQNEVISEDTKSLIKGGKTSHKLTSLTVPALVQTTTDADGNTEDKILQKAQGRIIAEKAVTEEKKKQKKLTQENTQQEANATNKTQERAKAEQKATENKKKGQTTSSSGGTTPQSTPFSAIKVPESGNSQGGILGLLGQIATEQTLKSIASLLAKGVKTTSSGDGGGKSGKKDDNTTTLSDSEALSKLQEKIKADYPEFASVSNSRAVSGGHVIDVFQYKNLDKIKEARAEIERLNNEGKAGTEEWNIAQQHLNALLSEQEKITLKINTTTGEITTKSSFQNLAVGAKAASKELQNVDAIMSQLQEVGVLSFGSNGEITSSNQAVQNYLNSLIQLQTYKDGLSQDALFDPSTQQQLSNLTLATQNYRKEVMSLLKDVSQLNSGAKIGELTGGIAGLDDSAIKKSMQEIVAQSTQLETTFGKLTPVTNELGQVVSYQLTYTLRTGKREVQEMTASLNPLTNELRVQKGAVKEVATGWDQFWSGLKGKAASIMQYLISITSIHDIFRYMRQAVEYVRNIDSALTELKKVTDETDTSYAKFLQNMAKTGSVIGATVSDLTTMAADWSRLGYSMEEASKLAESTAILLNVSEFQDATAASEALISTMQAFQYTADDSQRVVDILNEVGNNYAVSSDGIATALQDSASALMEAGNNLEQSVALVAAANKVVQDPNSVGSALRTISLRLRGTSVKVLEEMGEETDGVVESVSKMQKKIEALTGVNILTDSGAYKETYTILKEIGTVWEDMSDIDQAALLELMAGKNRANTLAAILGNMKDLNDAYQTALHAEGSALKENESQLDSIQGRITLFNNALQTMWMNLLDTDVIKGVVDAGTLLMKFLDSGIGRITAFGAILAAAGKFLKISPAITAVNGQFQILGKTTETIKNNFTHLSRQSTGLFGAIKAGLDSVFLPSDLVGGKIDLSGMLSEGDFTEKINGLLTGFNQLKGTVNEIPWDDYVDGVMKSDAAMGAALKTCTEQNGAIVAGQGAYQAYTGATTAAAIGNTAVGTTAQVTTGKLIAMKVAAVAAQAALTMGLSLLISLALEGVMAWANASEAAKDAANDAVDASKKLKEQSDSLKEYKEQIIELRKELDGNTLSESEAYDAREKLLKIQSDLVDQYGLEKDGINLVTGAIRDQIAALDELSRKESQKWLNTHQTEINDAIKYFEDQNQGGKLDGWWERLWAGNGIVNHSATWNVVDLIDEYAANNSNMISRASGDREAAELQGDNDTELFIEFTGSAEEVKTTVEDFMTWLGDQEQEISSNISDLTSLPLEQQTDDVKAQIKSLQADLSQLQDVREDIGTEYNNWFGDDSTYASNKKLLEQTQLNTAITQYADQYMKILDAENALIEAQAKGDEEGIQKALNSINTLTAEAASDAQTNGQNYMVDFFNGIKDGYSKMSSQMKFEMDLSKNLVWGKKDTLLKPLEDLKDMNAEEILQFAKINPENSAIATLNQIAQNYGLTLKELINSLVKFGYLQSGFNEAIDEFNGTAVKTYSAITEDVEEYNNILQQTSEIVTDNTEVTQEYKDSLKELGISEAELNECFYEGNPLIVKNADALNELVKSKQKNSAQNTKLAKTQAMLKYYELYKKIKELTNGTEVIDGATQDYIDSLYEQMGLLQKTINKYSILESELLGAANAYDKLAEAQEADEAKDYGSKAEELVNVLGDAINSRELGTEAAQVAIEGLVPESVIENATTLEGKMDAIYTYFTNGPISQLFTIEFDDDGAITSVEMTEENLKKYINDSDVFSGTWDNFTLDPSIQSMEDFMAATNMTKEMAFAFFTELERYDISWLDGKYSNMMDQLLGGNLDYAIYKTTEQLAALEMKIAKGTITPEELAQYNTLTESLSNLGSASRETVSAYNEASEAMGGLKDELATYKQQLDSGEITEEEYAAKVAETTKQMNDLAESMKEIEPTDLRLQLAVDDVQEDIESLTGELEKKYSEFKIETYIDFDEKTGTYTVKAEYQEDQDLVRLASYLTEEHALKVALGDGFVTVEEHLADIVDILNKVYDIIVEIDDSGIWTWWKEFSSASLTKKITMIWDWATGKSETDGAGTVNGTANIHGTAYSGGTWGAKKTETSLTGELGPELRVDPQTGRWDLLGEHGAEFVDVKRGDIIFNHKQTESLLKNGSVASRGKAYALGTSSHSLSKFNMSRLSLGTDYTIDDYLGKKTQEAAKNASAAATAAVTAANAANATARSVSGVLTSAITAANNSITTWYDTPTGNTLAGDYGNTGTGSDSSDEFEEKFDWFEVKLEEITEELDLFAAQLENCANFTDKNAKIQEMMTKNIEKQGWLEKGIDLYEDEANKYLAKIDSKYHDMVKSGAVAIEDFVGDADEATLEAINSYREYAQKAADLTQQLEETVTELRKLAIQKIDNAEHSGAVRATIEDSQTEKLQNVVDYDSERGLITDPNYYAAMMENSTVKMKWLINSRNEMQKLFDEAVENGQLTPWTDAWYEELDKLYQIDTQIDEATKELEEFQNAINDIYWENFDQLINRLDYISEETQGFIDLMDSADMVSKPDNEDGWGADDVEWTKEGLATLGLHAQEMERAEEKAKMYAQAIDDLTTEYEAGHYSESEYYEKLNELTQGQYEAIEAAQEEKEAIVELHEQRVDEIKNGINKQIDAYKKLIDTKKKELETEKD